MENFEVTKAGLQRQPSVGPTPGGKKVPWLLAIVFVVLATSVTLLALHFSLTYKDLTEQTLLLQSNAESLQDNKCEKQFCESKDCVQMAVRLLEFMNPEADPCSDFYEFACGGFGRSRTVPHAHHYFTPVTEAHHKILRNIKGVMENVSSHNESQTIQKLKQLYSTCTNTGQRKNVTTQSLEHWLSDINLSLSGVDSDDAIDLDSKGSWRKLVASLEDYGIHTVIKPTFKSLSSVPIETIELDCILPTFRLGTYSNPTESESAYLLGIYKRVIYFVLDELKLNEAEKSEFLSDVIQMETEIATAIENSRFSAISDISEEHTRQMKEVYRNMLGDTVQDVNIVSSCKYNLEDMLSVLNNAPPKRSARYVAWRMISQILQYLGGEFRNLQLHFVSRWLSNDYALSDPWAECSDVLRKELGLAVFKTLVDSGYVRTETIREVNNLFMEAKGYLIRAVRSSDWLQDSTSKTLINKIQTMEFNSGYSELIQELNTLDTVFRDLKLEDDYFLSVMNIKKFKIRHALNRLWYGNPESPISQISLDNNPLGFTSQYDYVKNAVRMEFGLLRPPVFFYQNIIPKYLKYGETSLLIREMSHVIDATGVFKELKGMDQAVLPVQLKYDSYSTCMLNQTLKMQNNIYPEFFKTQSLNDMIADMGSFQFAYKSLIAHLRKNKMFESTLPGISLTKKQTYFTQVAQGYCSLQPYLSASLDDEFDIPARLRVNIAVSNIEEFGNSFNCPPNSPLIPETRCNIFHTT